MTESDDPKTFTVQRSLGIAASRDAVFARLVDFHRWVDWSPWEGLDPAMTRTYEGADSGVGSAYSWTGNRKVGQGRMEIVAADAPSSLEIDLQFLKPFKARNVTRFSLAEDTGSTLVTWTMTGPKTLMTKVMGIFTSMDKVVGRDFEKGLAQLKAVAEKES